MSKLGMREVLKSALRLFGYLIAFGFLGFMFVPALIEASAVLRLVVVGALIVGVGALLFLDAASWGERETAMSDTLAKLEKKGNYTPSMDENAKRYRRIKGILAAVIGALPLALMAAYVAVTAEPFAYTVQDLPQWMTPYLQNPELGDALAYMRGEPAAATLVDYLRIAVRFMLFPFVGIAGTMTDEMSLLFDRISPLLSLIMPAVFAVGYQFGPARRKKAVEAIETAKRTPRKRLKKDRRQTPGAKEKKQLV